MAFLRRNTFAALQSGLLSSESADKIALLGMGAVVGSLATYINTLVSISNSIDEKDPNRYAAGIHTFSNAMTNGLIPTGAFALIVLAGTIVSAAAELRTNRVVNATHLEIK